MGDSDSMRVNPGTPNLSDDRLHALEEHGAPQGNLTEVEQLTLTLMRREPWFSDDPPSAPAEQTDAGTGRILKYLGQYAENLEALGIETEQQIARNKRCEREKAKQSAVAKLKFRIESLGNECTECDADDEKSEEASSAPARANPPSSSNTDAEPFPDYFESCEDDQNPPVVDRGREEAYNLAISKVYEEAIRFRGIGSHFGADSDLTNDNGSPSDTTTSSETAIHKPLNDDVVTDEQNAEGDGDTQSSSPPSSSFPSPGPMYFINGSESDKVRVIEVMKHLIFNPRLQTPVKHRFEDLSNKVVQLEFTLFHNQTDVSQEFLSAADTYEVRNIATDITRYLTVVDNRLTRLLDLAHGAHRLMGCTYRDDRIDDYIRYRRLVHERLSNHLFKPTELEKNILEAFFDLYDTFVYTSFLNIRNRQILLEDIVDIERTEITRLLVALWDILCRVIENYDIYLGIMTRIEEEYLIPTIQNVEGILRPLIGTRFEESMRMLMNDGADLYPDSDLSVLRPEDEYFP